MENKKSFWTEHNANIYIVVGSKLKNKDHYVWQKYTHTKNFSSSKIYPFIWKQGDGWYENTIYMANSLKLKRMHPFLEENKEIFQIDTLFCHHHWPCPVLKNIPLSLFFRSWLGLVLCRELALWEQFVTSVCDWAVTAPSHIAARNQSTTLIAQTVVSFSLWLYLLYA